MSKVSIEEQIREVHCIIDGAIGWLRIDNQRRLNAMTLSMWQNLALGAARLSELSEIRVIILAGAGGKAFCSGGDISEFSEKRYGETGMRTYDAVGRAALESFSRVGKPTIAMIEGYCLGGGIALALACDLRIAADSARLGVPAAKRGLSYDFATTKRLADLVGPANAKQILYTGESYAAEVALRMGLLNEVVPHRELETHTRSLCSTLAANAPLSLFASKLIVDMTMAEPGDRDLAACRAAEQTCLSREDYAEAIRAFNEKRVPVFHGK